ncbi:IQ-domain [Ancistrocladus abbreviatus]
MILLCYSPEDRISTTGREDQLGKTVSFQIPQSFLLTWLPLSQPKARVRRTGSPSPRPKMNSDAYSDGDSPYKHKLSPMSSINSEVTVGGYCLEKPSCSHQRSPHLKRLSVLVRSSRNFKDVSLGSESSLLNWDHHNAFR